MRTYEFINPSDKILFDAPSPEVAALAALVVGGGQCGATDVETDETAIGIALLGGDGGYKERYNRDVGSGLTALATETVAACQSFRLAHGKRSSLNDWCGYAHLVALKGAK